MKGCRNDRPLYGYFYIEVMFMHMADALISPVVGGVMLAGSVAIAAFSIKKIKLENDENRIPMMGVMGAFIFAAQMINFTIPATGSSGHLGGGLLLAALLGPQAGFLTMACVLLIQALFFADGGLLAFGCNLINIGFFACFIAYPLIFKVLTKRKNTPGRILSASMISSIVGLQFGAFAVVMETLLSGKTELTFGTFLLFMQPIHLAIGIVEGLITSAILVFVMKARPEMLHINSPDAGTRRISRKGIIGLILAAALIIGGCVSWFASAYPDGLEWSVLKTTGSDELPSEDAVHQTFSDIQSKTALMPDYGFKDQGGSENGGGIVNAGTSFSGILGSLMILAVILMIGLASGYVKKKTRRKTITE